MANLAFGVADLVASENPPITFNSNAGAFMMIIPPDICLSAGFEKHFTEGIRRVLDQI
ncbi:hypothetical protein OAF50_01090 [bacterium]|nr:hypothetical protein [bacterium]